MIADVDMVLKKHLAESRRLIADRVEGRTDPETAKIQLDAIWKQMHDEAYQAWCRSGKP